jgi:hypothetical protein
VADVLASSQGIFIKSPQSPGGFAVWILVLAEAETMPTAVLL